MSINQRSLVVLTAVISYLPGLPNSGPDRHDGSGDDHGRMNEKPGFTKGKTKMNKKRTESGEEQLGRGGLTLGPSRR